MIMYDAGQDNPSRQRLVALIAQRDNISREIALVEDAIRRAEYDVCFHHQLISINEQRRAEGKQILTADQFAAGIPPEE